jgi:hypothetical protein
MYSLWRKLEFTGRIADFTNRYYGALVVTTVVAGGAFTSVTVAMNQINNKIVNVFLLYYNF